MLYVKEANFGDIDKEWAFVRDMPVDENGLTNSWHGISREDFEKTGLPDMIRYAKGIDLPDWMAPETYLFLWDGDRIVGQFRIRHYLNDALREGAGHLGYYVGKEFRGKHYGTKGLALTLEVAKEIVPEDEFYLRVNKDNPASLHVMQNNGGRIVGENEEKYFVRIENPGPQHAYLSPIRELLVKEWPDNRTVNIVCHGHSVPAGYRATPVVDTMHSYPQLLLGAIKEHYPAAVVNVIVTAIGGEHSVSGAARFSEDVLCHKPDVLTIDYALNDRTLSLDEAEEAWRAMIEEALRRDVKVILMTPTWDMSFLEKNEEWDKLVAHAKQIRRLADEYNIGLCDSFKVFEREIENGASLEDLMSYYNHPNNHAHELVAEELDRFFV